MKYHYCLLACRKEKAFVHRFTHCLLAAPIIILVAQVKTCDIDIDLSYYSRTRGKYGSGESEERFTYSLALVFVQCVVNYVYAVLMSRLVLQQGQDRTKTSYYAVCSFTYLAAMVSSNKALMWVSYPTQVSLVTD